MRELRLEVIVLAAELDEDVFALAEVGGGAAGR